MKLIKEWRAAWKMFSTWALIVSNAALPIWVSLPQRFQTEVEGKWVMAFSVLMLILGIAGRLTHQSSVEDARTNTGPALP